MCGRFTLAADESDLESEFAGMEFPSTFARRYNIAPSQPVLVIPNDGSQRADFMRWGLIPSWAKDPAIGNRLINARGETLSEKPSFSGSFKYKRCLILADGFFEWQRAPGSTTKIPHYIQLATRKPFAMAGLWSEWNSADGSQLRTCTIVTTTPNDLIAPIHDRMPVILAAQDRSAWIDRAPTSSQDLTRLIGPYPADQMRAHVVSALVNSPSIDRPDCIAPA